MKLYLFCWSNLDIRIYTIIVLFMISLSIVLPMKTSANPLMIAHAGGGVDGKRYTNSLEALDLNYVKGFRYFEIDFSWTSDNQLVCLHDWKKRFKLNFGYKTKNPLSLQQFHILLDKQEDRHPCTLETLSNWVSLHQDSTIITDVKFDNINAIKHIKKYYPDLIKNIVPQFYQPYEYKVLKHMGFKKLIWILYQFEGKKSSIREQAKDMDLLAISMRASQVKKKWAQDLIKSNQFVFVYTINKIKDLNRLTKKYGVTGIYTDFLPIINLEL